MQKKNNKAVLLWLTMVYSLGVYWAQPALAEETSPPAAESNQQPNSGDVVIPQVSEEEIKEAETIIDEVKQRKLAADEAALQPDFDDEQAIKVPHVPEFIKDEIRQQVRADLTEDVIDAVLTKAAQERWGVPGSTPEWIDRIKLGGDFRYRIQGDYFADENFSLQNPDTFGQFGYKDYQAINEQGSEEGARDEFINNYEDRIRQRYRARVEMEAKASSDVKAKFRLTTGNSGDPVSTNVTLGNSFNSSGVVWDRAYLQYDAVNMDGYTHYTLMGGRMKNPFFFTDLVWDNDVNFDGLALTYRLNLSGSGDLLEMSQRDRTMFATLGVFPLQEVALSSEDKWLFGFQLGTQFVFQSQSAFKLALAYYDYKNIEGKFNQQIEDDSNNYTAPGYMQKGNLLFDIANPLDPGSTERLYALAADYNLINLTASYDIAAFVPIHFIITADYVKNIGYDRNAIENRTRDSRFVVRSGCVTQCAAGMLDEHTDGYQLDLTVGWPDVTYKGNWRASLAYKYLERDAVLDAFTDSDFHLGGTDAQGWILSGELGLAENVWSQLRILSSREIESDKFSVDTLQIDVNAKF